MGSLAPLPLNLSGKAKLNRGSARIDGQVNGNAARRHSSIVRHKLQRVPVLHHLETDVPSIVGEGLASGLVEEGGADTEVSGLDPPPRRADEGREQRGAQHE